MSRPEQLREFDEKIAKVREQKEAASEDQDFEKAAALRDEEKSLLAERRARGLGAGTLEWVDGLGTDVVAFRNGSITVVANLSDKPIELPSGVVVVSSGPLAGRMLPVDQAVWLTGE